MIESYSGDDLNAVYYMSIDDSIKKTIKINGRSIEIMDGKPDNADCIVKMTSELLKKVWYEGYVPGMKEIFSGALKTNNPELLSRLFSSIKRG
ncbi:MAG: hypothetical protein LDL10_06565, partial [Calditerrivibrio sp.]|nr:hypothetical protein [Calditerrivibrio sp.]